MRICQQTKVRHSCLAWIWSVLLAWTFFAEVHHGLADPSQLASFEAEFEESVYPLMLRGGEQSCVQCHDAATSSDLVFVGQPKDDFRMLLTRGYFALTGPDTLLGRLTAANPKRRMPKGKDAKAWTPEEIERIRGFATALADKVDLAVDDESFPSALLVPYEGPLKSHTDTQFLTYTQLKNKVATLFEDRWVRDGVDQFEAHVALLGGADFKTRFNESAQATSGYMTALRRLASDVAERSYVTRSGPFGSGWAADRWMGGDVDGIRHLYRAVLFRDPTAEEIESAQALFAGLEANVPESQARAPDLNFEVTVTDPHNGERERREIRIPVAPAIGGAVYQAWWDQSAAEKAPAKEPIRFVLPERVELHPGRSDQFLRIETTGADGPVSYVGILLEQEAGKTVEWIGVEDSRTLLQGAWKQQHRSGFTSVEAARTDQETSRIEVSLAPDYSGAYRVTVYGRRNSLGSRRALVEVHHAGAAHAVANLTEGPIIRDGAVQFTFDGTEDAVPFVEFAPRFRFGDSDYVEVNNAETKQKVAVGPVAFLSEDHAEVFEIDPNQAEGFGDWSPFKAISFSAYNRRGTRVEDRNAKKGELFLRYFPRSQSDGGWLPEAFYRLRIYYPGKRDHEPRTPAWVRAQASSPLVRIARPVRASVGHTVTLDLSETATLQGSGLQFAWRQLAGPPVGTLPDGPRVSFEVPPLDSAYLGWVALTQALIRHPDFLFTRSPALDWVSRRDDQRALRLNRLALDLVGRSPTLSERQQFLADWDWDRMVHYYLDSEDFKTFYRHRIRLYLESQGTVLQDEPVRLWCYVAFHDLPFQQILTGDFTVDTEMQRQARPWYHGRTGVLSTAGFIAGKPGLPHYNYAAQVSMLFLGYQYEVPAEIVEQREGVTPLGTTDPNSTCYSCHKILTPLAFQRNFWSDEGAFRMHDEFGLPIEASDHGLVEEYPFKGEGLEAFALQAARKERFIRTMINTHFDFLFGRSLRLHTDERELYKSLWDAVHESGFTVRGLLRAIVQSSAYREEPVKVAGKQ